MITFDKTWLKHSIVEKMKSLALTNVLHGTGQGLDFVYLERCKACSDGTLMIFTRDVGYHSGGWWKNPDYERCYHLSLSFRNPNGTFAPKNQKLTDEWLDLFYGANKNLVWAEPPYYQQAKNQDIWHYRLFCDEHWRPIQPRGEVYSTQFTERGWKSFSELNAFQAELIKQEG